MTHDEGWDDPAPRMPVPKGVDIDLFHIKGLIRWLKKRR
jgi:hypothetical protein